MGRRQNRHTLRQLPGRERCLDKPNEPGHHEQLGDLGMGRAIVQAGKKGRVVAIGFDGNADLQAFIKDGTLEAIAVQSAYQMGSLGVKTAVEVIQGKKVPKFRDTGVIMVNKTNIDSHGSEERPVLT